MPLMENTLKIEMRKTEDIFEIGAFTGRRQAFAALAGTCSAADAECLRRVRERRMYKALGLTWEGFCRERAGVSRVTADKLIRRLEEFGPVYFQLAQVTGIAESDYRRIAGSIRKEGLAFQGEVIPIQPEHAPRLTAAVGELCRQTAPAKAKQLESAGPATKAAPAPEPVPESTPETASDPAEAAAMTTVEPGAICPTGEPDAGTVALQPEAANLPGKIHAAATPSRLPDAAMTLQERIGQVEQALRTAVDQLEALRPFSLHFCVRDRLNSLLKEGLLTVYEIKELPRTY